MEDLGLSKGEIKVYLVLLGLGSTKIGKVIEKSGMVSSAVYNSIAKLIGKGLVSYIRKGKIKFYQSVPPNQILEFIKEKKKRFMEILPELELKEKFPKEKQQADIFEGEKGIMSMLNLLTEKGHKGDEYVFFAVTVEQNKKIRERFFIRHDSKKKEKGIITRGLAPKELKESFKQRKFVRMRYPDYPIPSGISIFKNKVAFFSWEEKPVGYLIESEQIAHMYKKLFDSIWNNC